MNATRSEHRIAVYILDADYGRTGEVTGHFKTKLEAEYGCIFEEVDIGAGASLPAWVTWPRAIAGGAVLLFLSGEPIVKNLEDWSKIYNSIAPFFKMGTILNKDGAAVVAMREIQRKLGVVPKAARLIGYEVLPYASDEELREVTCVASLENGGSPLPDPSFIGFGTHVFCIDADERRFIVTVNVIRAGDKGITIRELWPSSSALASSERKEDLAREEKDVGAGERSKQIKSKPKSAPRGKGPK
jgi:hypothetical protein